MGRAHRDEWWVPDDAVDDAGVRPARVVRAARRRWWWRSAPGSGRRRWRWRPSRPAYDVLGFEVWHPGVADTFHRMEQAGVSNVRMISVDAVWSMQHLLGERQRAPSCGRSSPTRGPSSGTTAAGWCGAGVRARSRRAGWCRAGCGGWRPTGRTTPSRWRGARRRAAAGERARRSGAALGGPAADAVRAPRARGGPVGHRPGLPASPTSERRRVPRSRTRSASSRASRSSSRRRRSASTAASTVSGCWPGGRRRGDVRSAWVTSWVPRWRGTPG